MTEVICDNKRLVYSNRICCLSNESIGLKIDLTDSDAINIVFNFIEEGEELKTSVRSPENGKIIFELNNYNNPLGSGVRKPVEIGELKGKKIYVVFYVYRITEECLPILDISLYLEV